MSFMKKKHEKDVVGTVTFGLTGFLPTIILLLIFQWPTGDCEETFDVTSKIAQTTQNILKQHSDTVLADMLVLMQADSSPAMSRHTVYNRPIDVNRHND